ncbi:MAG: aminopeptidase P N-terminal domain-containing protein [Planctomycetes bacterium]|nr:aminopeptidase P N-terminal domain-containing protein [Planctomycetota bacterium]
MEGGVAVIPTAAAKHRNGDAEYRFRPDSDFWWLTGFHEPDAVLLLCKGRPDGEQLLFLQPRQRDQEIWTGRRLGVERAVERLGVDAAFPIGELQAQLPKLLRGAEPLYFKTGARPDLERPLLDLVATLRTRVREGNPAPERIVDPTPLLAEMRLHKDAGELATMREAAAITCDAHVAAMRATRPGVTEHAIEALVEHEFRRRGANGPAYTTIAASGANATILHYIQNDCALKAGELMLLDAGAEVACYAADVTRTWPISGRYSPPQRRVVEIVLEAQRRSIDCVRPGRCFQEAHDVAVRALVEGLLELKLLTGSVEEAIASKAFRRFYMHRTGHWLGLDVHDAGAYFVPRSTTQHRDLAPGMVVTVEPGLYFAEDDTTIPAEYRGIGVRIEDDVLVTPEGHEVLTAACPKEIAAVEALVGSG